MPVIRRGDAGDLARIAGIQAEGIEAAQWNVADYLGYDLLVALVGGRLAGFLISRPLAADECELLNLVVALEFRRQGVARALLESLLSTRPGVIYLEVRESNQAARNLYKSMGFKEVNVRKEYYRLPLEAAIVMKFHSC